MTDLSAALRPALSWRPDRAWIATVAIALAVLVLDTPRTLPVIGDAANSLLHTLPFVLFACAAIGWLEATGAKGALARAFEGREARMVAVAALAGALSPFCSCEVIPFIAALLAAGAPLSAVMAFWLASPLMDPAMFAITAGALGTEIAVWKGVSAVVIAASAGYATMALSRSGALAEPLRQQPSGCGCCGSKIGSGEAPVWRFWPHPERRAAFGTAARDNFVFLIKWLGLAYMIEAVMVRYVPEAWIGAAVGGDGLLPVATAAAIGAPAYLNGYAAPALVGGLMEQGMTPGAGLAFLIAGGVTCIPAAVAVWALVKRRIFALYLVYGFAGAIGAGLVLDAAI